MPQYDHRDAYSLGRMHWGLGYNPIPEASLLLNVQGMVGKSGMLSWLRGWDSCR
jgi:hypothetical protein